MYARIETIEEECLDWGNNFAATLKKSDKEITKSVQPSEPKHEQFFLKEYVTLSKNFNIIRKFTDVLNQRPELSFIFSMLTLPYVLGFLISYFLYYTYGGMPISHFVHVGHVSFQVELWSMGAYICITLLVIWLVLGYFYKKK